MTAPSKLPAEQSTNKVSLELPNVANNILNWLSERWPALPNTQHMWVTGSNVWSHLYDMEPPKSSDLDIFICRNYYRLRGKGIGSILKLPYKDPLDAELEAILKWARELPAATSETAEQRKMTTSLGGTRVYSEFGSLDIWLSSHNFVHDQLKSYPDASHAHCRAAVNPASTQLIILPNNRATKDGAFQDVERKALMYAERLDALRKP